RKVSSRCRSRSCVYSRSASALLNAFGLPVLLTRSAGDLPIVPASIASFTSSNLFRSASLFFIARIRRHASSIDSLAAAFRLVTALTASLAFESSVGCRILSVSFGLSNVPPPRLIRDSSAYRNPLFLRNVRPPNLRSIDRRSSTGFYGRRSSLPQHWRYIVRKLVRSYVDTAFNWRD